jgi:hypothetical protein
MAASLDIGRLRARYRLPAAAAAPASLKRRLDDVLRLVLDDALEGALAAVGVREHEEVCVRSVEVALRLDPREHDQRLAAAWSAAIAAALRARIAAGGPAEVVRYGSRAHALVDVLTGAAAGDRRRAWAWRQLGLWGSATGAAQAADGADLAVAALLAMPEAAPAALAAAGPVAIARLSRMVNGARWGSVAARALAAAGLDPRAIDGAAAAPAAGEPLRAGARRILAAAPFAIALAGGAAPAAGAARERLATLRAVAALAALAAEPAALARAGAPLLDAVAALLEAAVLAAERGPPDRAAAGAGRPREGPGAAAGREPPGARAGVADEPDDRPLPEVRRSGRTRAGGLLFLLHVVAELGLPETLCAEDGALAARPLRWALHALALALLPLEPRDPAALAFCGLAPGAEPPCDGEAPPSEPERAALAAAAGAVAIALRARLRRDEEPARAVLLEACRRDAELLADPAWIEVRLALEAVDVGVRRAGLDLDPGWLPWLGCVVRFTYA